MKASTTLWLKRIVIGTAVAALPQILLARSPGPADLPPPFAAEPPAAGEMLPPELAVLHGIELSEAQQDAVFALLHGQMPEQRALAKKAAKAFDELRRSGTADSFDAKKAHALADAYAQAIAQISFNRAELDAKLRALLSAEQRARLDAARRDAPPRGPGARDGGPRENGPREPGAHE